MITKIKSILDNSFSKGDFPGASFCLIENGEINCDFVGNKSLFPTKIINSVDTIYDVASLSKVVSTTTLLFKLIKEDKLTLDTKVSDVLPSYKHLNTTVSDLLLHTSGLAPIVSNASTINTKEGLIKQVYLEELIYEPRTKVVYSDTGFILLGFVLEAVTGSKISDLADKYIFNVIGMKDSGYSPDINRTAPTECDENIENCILGNVHDERSRLLNGNTGHAGVFSTAYDITLFIKSILENENVFTNEQKDLIFGTSYNRPNMNSIMLSRSYGYEKYVSFPSLSNDIISHTGFTGVNFWVDRKENRGFVLLTNAIHPKRENNKVFESRAKIFELFYDKENDKS